MTDSDYSNNCDDNYNDKSEELFCYCKSKYDEGDSMIGKKNNFNKSFLRMWKMWKLVPY